MTVRDTLCWKCSNTKNCKWIAKGAPIKGWIVENGITSKKVISCPNYSDEEKPMKITDEGASSLASAVLVAAGREYDNVCAQLEKDPLVESIINGVSLKNLMAKKETLEHFFGNNFYSDIIEVNGDYVIETAKENHGIKKYIEENLKAYQKGVKDGYEYAENKRKYNSPLARVERLMEERRKERMKHGRKRKNKDLG